jgi:hypothetical protein
VEKTNCQQRRVNTSHPTTVISPERRTIVARACKEWIGKLIDLSRNNRLLYFRDLKTGTLEFSDPDPKSMLDLLRGQGVSLTRLLPRADEQTTISRAQEIRRNALANLEEKGLETLFVAFGFATWPANDEGRPAQSPVLMAPVAFEKRGRETRALSLRISGDFQINPILLYVLEKEHGQKVLPESVLEVTEGQNEEQTIDPRSICDRLQGALAGLKGFNVTSRVVLGNFAFQKMAMVKDLQEHADVVAGHDLVAAIAGDSAARQTIRDAANSGCDGAGSHTA